MSSSRIGLGSAALALLVAACSQDELHFRPHEDAGTALPEFVPETFDQLYPVFLLRKIEPGVKAALWKRYMRKWVHWTGRVISFTPNGLTLKHLPTTVTFDVSLWVDPANRPKLKLLHVGDTVTYIGRLDSYDDVFRTMYLVHGDIAAGAPPPLR